MISARNNGFTLVELAVIMVLTAIIVSTTTTFFNSAAVHFARMRTAQIYQQQVTPIQNLLHSQVRNCKLYVYRDLASARAGGSSGIQSTGLFLRCERANGYFVLAWDENTKELRIITSNNDNIIFTSSLETCSFDISQGFLQMNLSVRAPLDTNYFRTQTVSGVPVVSYRLFTEGVI